jgi:hypothetical protein
MDLQTIFYIIAIIYMIIMLAITVAVLYMANTFKNRVEKVQQDIKEKAFRIIAPTSIISMGSVILKNLVGKLRK